MKLKKQPVKLPIKPINIVKCGMTTAKIMVTTTTATRNPKVEKSLNFVKHLNSNIFCSYSKFSNDF